MLDSTARVARRLAAGARRVRTDVVGEIGIEPPLDRPRRQREGPLANGSLQSLEIKRCDCLGAD